VAKLNPDGTVKSIEPFITGFIVDNNYIGRPVDMEWLKDGSSCYPTIIMALSTASPTGRSASA
jgi:hypothetical protein